MRCCTDVSHRHNSGLLNDLIAAGVETRHLKGIFTSVCSSPRERAARNCPVLCCSWSITQYKSNEHALGLSTVEEPFFATLGLQGCHQLHTSRASSHTSPSSSDTHNVGNTHRTAPHANAMGAPFASPIQMSMLEFQHSLYTHSKCLRTL